ncbi:hypothetical protein [Prescottella equi]|uniref:hypothetical protein n=1 Tax=Rhodococcus hoagii TaxID=43767 RepID=UPI000A0F5B5A|nr:hypothetical protein [Prescottella equi]NKR41616.1 hypothetical protein [Prescottella equi]NKR68990.1 hypothetical protein [Prescottella equi]ORJ94243.1 hypothetical protein A6F58_17310 [Prescottella equi]
MNQKSVALSTEPNPERSTGAADDDLPMVTNHETRMALLDRSNRAFAVVPKVFVQKPRPPRAPRDLDRSGLLSEFVTNGDLRGLRAFLLLCAFISSGDADDGWSATHPIRVWARAFDTTATAELRSASAAVSKVLTRLEHRKLITRNRQGRERKVKVTLLHPDGSSEPFRRKAKDGKMVPYLKLPNVYWEKWYDTLKLPELTMLLVLLHGKPSGFSLAAEWYPQFYGWSADTAERGLKRLEELDLVTPSEQWTIEPLSPIGRTRKITYTLAGDFARSFHAPVVKGGEQL